MCHDLLRRSSLFDALLKFDQDLAAERRARGCPCGGRLHSARYPRKPRGGPSDLDSDYRWRFSFCCAEDDCRQRVTPPSVRFLGPRIYLGAVVVLVSAMVHGVTEKRLVELREQVSPTLSARTLRRWRVWWREIFVATPFWTTVRARYVPSIDTAHLPASLLERFAGSERRQLVAALEFLSPLSTRSPMAA